LVCEAELRELMEALERLDEYYADGRIYVHECIVHDIKERCKAATTILKGYGDAREMISTAVNKLGACLERVGRR
jgi:hypothetical protein